jgi:hypothetical protein
MDGSATTDALIARCRAEEDTLAELRAVLRNQLLRSGLPDIAVPEQLQACWLVRDPYDGSTSLVGEWRKGRDKLIGSVVIHANGQLIAELDVLRPLPGKKDCLVDAVVAFGRPGELHAELRLMPAIG